MKRAELDALSVKARDLAAFLAWANARMAQGERGDRRTYELAVMVSCMHLPDQRLRDFARELLTFPAPE